MEIEIAVCVIFFEKLEQTKECIYSVVNRGHTIYILNNNSSQTSTKKLTDWLSQFNNVQIFHANENLGPARGRNLLIQNAKEKWLLFLDNDITLTTNSWSENLKKHIRDNPAIDVFVPQLYNVHEKQWQNYHSYKIEENQVLPIFKENGKVNCFPGGASLVNKDLFVKIGNYDTRLYVLEDFELSIRALRIGKEINGLVIEDIRLAHHHKMADSSKDVTAIKMRYNADHYKAAEKLICESHKVQFYSGWEPWVSEQLNTMIYHSQWRKLKRRLRNKFISLWNKVQND